ncbi:MAG: hypothetical protein H6550_14820 [Chitinophagales bacterium]|nr:hypothetical protein [Chitinophagales bacterium]
MKKSIENLDLNNVKMKLMDPEEGQGWTESQCNIAEKEYKRFLNLVLIYVMFHQILSASHIDTRDIVRKYLASSYIIILTLGCLE